MNSSATPTAVYDDFSSAISYSEGWASFSNTTGSISASQYSNGTFHQCASAAISTGPTCLATFPFEGTGATVYGDSSSAHGRFFCAVDGGGKMWYDGGSVAEWAVGRVMCSVDGLERGNHTIVYGQAADDAGNSGVTQRHDSHLELRIRDHDCQPCLRFLGEHKLHRFSHVKPTRDSTRELYWYFIEHASICYLPTSIGIGVGVGGAAALALIGAAVLFWRRKRSTSK
ncbi:hypothetical protein BCR35DRAFT_334630 [Leucosporidium creatinivorum]|uniref:Uncharacterized protein n=1 Tax=Leucosporidium creatinivorum TaxID=106004 RepID=A0A1Y2E2W0_9BASI|nr:hypothetical protein BCR35DRAFT_334630 [Leucosporidium creatinivorum]